MLLDSVTSPADVARMSVGELDSLAEELRRVIIESVGRNGGHLASNLGSVELTLALHHEFDIPRDALVFDVGHQAYAHKLLTGRRDGFSALRHADGCSGFPSPGESPADTGVSGHAGVAVSLARGIASGRKKNGDEGRVIAVIGDGSLTNGITFEGLTSGRDSAKKLIVVLNDNKMSISKNVGGVSRCLNRVISGNFYNRLRSMLREFSRPRKRLYSLLSRIDDAVKSLILPPGLLFQELGFRYFGPVDGHDLAGLLVLFQRIKRLDGPILVHVLTTKGRGCDFAEKKPARYHGVSGFDPVTGSVPPSGGSFSGTFGECLLRQAEKDERIEAVSAAMIDGTGLRRFAKDYPTRCHDVGIAEAHAVIFSCGLAIAGRKPVCALYSTFAQRAFDCIYHDAVLAKLPVVFALDRAGIVEDGPTHHGIYDLAFLTALPEIVIMAPRNYKALELMLDLALKRSGPSVLRYPRGGEGPRAAAAGCAPLETGKAEVIRAGNGPVIWALGAEAETALAAAEILKREAGLECCVIDPRFLKPFDEATARQYAERDVIVIEDHAVAGGLGALLFRLIPDDGTHLRLDFGWPDEIIGHGRISELRTRYRLTPELIAEDISKRLAARGSAAGN
ncbi:MAG: 1-deoxy-D-xylulose-5-phosphate synthase [Lentisphaeria bacterium]|nr:1-deoxy-D-xylulose-5-phosphate synthase [Lentisphaeria bacterium]